MLWGPPGCGKSSSAERLRALYSPMYFINTDAIVESIIHNFYNNEYDILRLSASEQEKQAFYWKMRKVPFSELHDKTHKTYLDIIKTIYREVFTQVAAPDEFEIHGYTIFKYGGNKENLSGSSVCDFLGDFTVWLTKTRQHHFMIETTGASFDPRWAGSVFDVHNILQIVFVSTPETLIDRVAKRTGQLINASPDRIRGTYNTSYFESFANAVKSEIFNEIIVDVNDTTPLRVLHLKKAEFNDYGKRERYPYILAESSSFTSREPTPAEVQFITNLFSNASMPPEFASLGKRAVRTASWFKMDSILHDIH
jgi:hypothetical protein